MEVVRRSSGLVLRELPRQRRRGLLGLAWFFVNKKRRGKLN